MSCRATRRRCLSIRFSYFLLISSFDAVQILPLIFAALWLSFFIFITPLDDAAFAIDFCAKVSRLSSSDMRACHITITTAEYAIMRYFRRRHFDDSCAKDADAADYFIFDKPPLILP